MSDIYRGYDIERHPKEGYVVRKDGEIVTSQPSLEFAHSWIDKEKKRQAEGK